MAKGKYAKKRTGKGGLVLLLIVTFLVITGSVVGVLMVLNGEKPTEAPPQTVQTTTEAELQTGTTEVTAAATTQPTESTTAPTEATTAPTEETTVPIEETTAPTELPTLGSDATLGQQIAQTALAQVGKPYQSGGSGPDGFDPTGLVWYCLKQNGISAARKMKQLVLEGVEVPREELQPGDVVFFWTSNEGVVEYVGVYVGGGKFVAARNQEKPVSQLDFESNYFKTRYLTARRFAN